MNVAILDDYQNVALRLADWSGVRRHAEITVFNDHVADPSAVVERLRGATQYSLRDKSKPSIIWPSFRICQETSSALFRCPAPLAPTTSHAELRFRRSRLPLRADVLAPKKQFGVSAECKVRSDPAIVCLLKRKSAALP
jgi:hypothetical protein